jgi:5-methylcytosine-specific restriction enzyme A
MAKVPSITSRIVTLDTRSAAPPSKSAEPIYATREYAEWRRIVIRRAHGYCQDPACKYPNRYGIRLFADHIIELKDGGAPFDPSNGIARCGSCHTIKTVAERSKRSARRCAPEEG